jgi:hypothetical protein
MLDSGSCPKASPLTSTDMEIGRNPSPSWRSSNSSAVSIHGPSVLTKSLLLHVPRLTFISRRCRSLADQSLNTVHGRLWQNEGAGRREGSLQLGVAQVLRGGLPADPVVTGKEGFRNTGVGTLDQLGSAFRVESLFPPFVGAALFGQGDAFPRPFPAGGFVRLRCTSL